MAEPYDTRGARQRALATFAALSSPASTPPASTPPKPLTINDVPNDVLVSIFMAVGDLIWVKHTFPCVCKAWNELYLSKDASPLHETLEVNFYKEVKKAVVVSATREEEEEKEKEWRRGRLRVPHRLVVHGSRVISWAERRAGSVLKLRLAGGDVGGVGGSSNDFSPEDLRKLFAVVGSSLTEISLGFGVDWLCAEPFWDSLRDYVVPAGRLRSFVVTGMMSDTLYSRLGTLGYLVRSLEEVEVYNYYGGRTSLPRFPESFCRLTELRRLVLFGHKRIISLPAEISSLKKLEEITLDDCRLSSLPKELGELSGLTMLDLSHNWYLSNAHQDGALGKMKSLRVLNLSYCCLRAVPAFVGELESLEVLNLVENSWLQIDAPLDFLIKGCPRLREVRLDKGQHGPDPWTSESLTHLKAFKAKLLAKNPDAIVKYERR